MNALIVVDVQNDFLPGGALAVPRGDEVIPVINDLQRKLDLVVATQDWHPADHVSFAANHPGARVGDVVEAGGLSQILWPVHCVQDTRGADLAAALDRTRIAAVFHKGSERDVDSYSGFFDNERRRATGLAHWLRERDVDRIFVTGLATDYCVKYTALDGLALGFRTTVITDACRGIDLRCGDVEAALEEIEQAGGLVTSAIPLPLIARPELPAEDPARE